jgi:hypothetical protein
LSNSKAIPISIQDRVKAIMLPVLLLKEIRLALNPSQSSK